MGFHFRFWNINWKNLIGNCEFKRDFQSEGRPIITACGANCLGLVFNRGNNYNLRNTRDRFISEI